MVLFRVAGNSSHGTDREGGSSEQVATQPGHAQVLLHCACLHFPQHLSLALLNIVARINGSMCHGDRYQQSVLQSLLYCQQTAMTRAAPQGCQKLTSQQSGAAWQLRPLQEVRAALLWRHCIGRLVSVEVLKTPGGR